MGERLEEIKDYRKLPNNLANPDLFPPDIRQPIEIMRKDDIDWLIQQAEKVQELEAENERLRTRRDHLAHRLKLRREETQRYKEALEFYANKINYQVFIENGKSNIERDGGEKARQELKGDTK